MRIAFLAHNYPPVVGGMEIATHEVAKRLGRQGNSVRVFVARMPHGAPPAETMDAVLVERIIPQSMFDSDISSYTSFHRWLRYSRRIMVEFSHVFRELRMWGPDILHISCTPDLILCGLPIARILGRPIVVSAYGSDLKSLSDQAWYKRWLAKRVLLHSSYVITVSRDLEEIAKGLVPAISTKHEFIPSGVDCSFFHNAQRHRWNGFKYILSVGAMKHVKGYDVLLRAFALVGKRYPECRLILAGDGRLYDDMVKLAASLGLQERVLFWGLADREELAGLLVGSELVVMASRSEGMPLVILEAYACGRPVVATRVGGVGEIVEEGKTGLLVERERERELADAIIALLDDPEARRRMGNNGREKAKEYDWDRIAERYARVFGRITGASHVEAAGL